MGIDIRSRGECGIALIRKVGCGCELDDSFLLPQAAEFREVLFDLLLTT